MRQFFTLGSLIVVLVVNGYSQSDPEPDKDAGPFIYPGIYLTFENFITNSPIDPTTIETERDVFDSDFYFHLMREREVKFLLKDTTGIFYPTTIWGYSNGKAIYINKANFPQGAFSAPDAGEHPFARIIDLGQLSLIAFDKIIATEVAHNPGANVYHVSPARRKPVEFILDTRDGTIHKATLPNFEKMITDDAQLTDRFKKYTIDKDIKLYIFLKEYNRRNPFQFR